MTSSANRTLQRAAWLLAALVCLWVLYADVSPAWTPARSAFADVRGFSRGILNLVVLPAGQLFPRAPLWSVVLCAAALLVAAARMRFTRGTVIGAAAAAVVLSAVALAPVVSPYRVVLAPRTLALCVLLLGAGAFTDVGRWLRARWTPLLSGLLGLAFFASAMLQVLGTFGGNYSGFVRISRTVAEHTPFLQERPALAQSLILHDAGYDGQFVYFMAFDPFARRFADEPNRYRPFVDNPPYRYGRIGFSLLTDLASGGRPERFPATMMWIIVAAHFALAALLAARAVRFGRSPLTAMWYLAIPAFTASLLAALPEALAAATIVAGVLCWERGRYARAALWFGAALFVRETAIVPLAALALAAGWRTWKNSALALGAAIAPVFAWRLFVAWRFFPGFGWAALVANPGDFGLPFAGLARLWLAGVSHAQPSPEIAGAVVFPILLGGAFALSILLLAVRRGPLELAAAVYAAVAVSLNYSHIWSHLPSGERGTFELFLCLLLLLLERRGRPAWIGRTLTGFFVAMLAYTYFLAPDAAVSRAALLLIR
jgi:hypothetical protein